MLENTENKNNLKAIERFFCNNKRGAFLFVVGNDELVRADVIKKSKLLLFGSQKKIEIFSFHKDYNSDFTLLQNLNSFLNKRQVEGLVLIDLEYMLIDDNYDLMTQINFSREALLELKLPILFWIKKETVPKFSYYAADVYNQRVSSNIYFDYSFSNKTEMVTDGYLMEKTASNNASIENHKLRIKLLNEQLEQAIKSKILKKKIANDIVIELLGIYVAIPNSEVPIKNLLKEYYHYFDLKKTKNCFILARSFHSMNEFFKSEEFYKKALADYKKLAGTNPETYLPNVADTLNNLGVLQIKKKDYYNAELSYKEALKIRRTLAQSNSKTYLSDVVTALNNLGVLKSNKKDYYNAELFFNEALKIGKTLAETNPVVYLPAVAMTLNNLGVLQKNKNDYTNAELSYNESLKIYKTLAQTNPETYLLEVAMGLNNLGNLQNDKKDYINAELFFNEALKTLRTLAQNNPETYLPYVAITLNNLGNSQCCKKNYTDAEHSYNEALKIRRTLVQTNPEIYLLDVAAMLNNLGNLLSDKKDNTNAELSYYEALKIRRTLAQSNPETYLLDLASTLINLSVLYQENIIDEKKSLEQIKEAIEILISFSAIGYVKEYLINSIKVIKDWKINPETFLKENFPNKPELLDLLEYV